MGPCQYDLIRRSLLHHRIIHSLRTYYPGWRNEYRVGRFVRPLPDGVSHFSVEFCSPKFFTGEADTYSGRSRLCGLCSGKQAFCNRQFVNKFKANRLSEDPNNRVLLMEAGPRDYWWNWKIHMPAALMYNLRNDKYNWFVNFFLVIQNCDK